jgi:mRNA interferase MazF
MRAGQIVLFRFPNTDLREGKLRPALLIARVPGPYDDWLICMISSRLRQHQPGFDEIVRETDEDYAQSGLKKASVIRATRLAVVGKPVLVGSIGEIGPARLERIRGNLADWLRA